MKRIRKSFLKLNKGKVAKLSNTGLFNILGGSAGEFCTGNTRGRSAIDCVSDQKNNC